MLTALVNEILKQNEAARSKFSPKSSLQAWCDAIGGDSGDDSIARSCGVRRFFRVAYKLSQV